MTDAINGQAGVEQKRATVELHHSGCLFLPPSGSDQFHQASVSLSIQRWLVFFLFFCCAGSLLQCTGFVDLAAPRHVGS